MSTSRFVSWPPDARGEPDAASPRAPVAFGGVVTRSRAMSVAIAAWVLVALGDFLTTAEVAFTLLYLVPIAIASWWRGRSPGLAMAFLCSVTSTVARLGHGALPHGLGAILVFAWNMVGEIGVFVVFALVFERLRRRLDAEVVERETVVEQLRHADRLNTVGKLASGIAHELGTPLNVVSGRASLIVSGKTTGDDAKRSAAIIVQQAERMTKIIRGLLAFARRGGTKKTRTDLVELAEETIALVAPLAKKAGVQIAVEDGAGVVVAAEGGEIQQVLSNLLVNAVQAMPNGGDVVVRLGTERVGKASPLGLPEGTYATLAVRDHGVGIAPADLPHVFDPFFTTKEVGSGTGLGLSITFGIVRDHGGRIAVETAVGEGSVFTVYLPLAG